MGVLEDCQDVARCNVKLQCTFFGELPFQPQGTPKRLGRPLVCFASVSFLWRFVFCGVIRFLFFFLFLGLACFFLGVFEKVGSKVLFGQSIWTVSWNVRWRAAEVCEAQLGGESL